MKIYVEDMDRVTKFYKEVLQVNLRDMADPQRSFSIDESIPQHR